MGEKQDKWEMVMDIDSGFNRQFHKVKGLAGVFFCEEAKENRELTGDQANGIYYILEEIAEGIQALRGKVDDYRKYAIPEAKG